MPIKSGQILIVGGAGYIGSHMVLALQRAGYEPIVLDNLSTGYQDAVINAKLIVGDMGNREVLEKLFNTYRFDAVMHFASFIEVAESVRNPLKYYQNNVAATLTLLEVMLKQQVKHFIFSSTAAVYGEPKYTPINEAHPLAPINPYGNSKRMVENILKDLSKSDDLQYASLRYFNAAGADSSGTIGERHEPETHLIPLVLQVASGKRKNIMIYGQDYPTLDGTCVRDYVHVMDICEAHILALQAIQARQENIICNLGTGYGYSVKQVINTAQRITNRPIPIIEGDRRPGDPAVLVADATLANKLLQWQPKYSDLDTIIRHAWGFTSGTGVSVIPAEAGIHS